MAKRLAKKANPVKVSRKSEITKNTKTTATKKAKAVKKTPVIKVAKKVISSSPKMIQKKAAVTEKTTAVKTKTKIMPKSLKTKPAQVKIKIDMISSKKSPVVKPIKNSVKKEKNVKKSMTIIPEQKVLNQHEEDYMNPQQQKHFRMILLDWKKQLLGEMERTVHHMQDEAANFPDPNDRATQEEEFSLELRARDRERKLIKKIDEALIRLDNHDYGYCEACGVEIGEQRLSARPTATLCIDCKTIDEIREKHFS